METQALINLLTEARAGLFPFISKRIDENGNEYETDFCTEVFCFHSNLLSVFQELEKNAINNSINFNSEIAGNYSIQATKILFQVRDQLRHFFHEDNEYQIQVRQIESENIIDEPYLEYTPADSISETKLEYPVKEIALYANKICQWGVLLLQRYTTEQGVSGGTSNVSMEQETSSSWTVQILLMYHTGIYSDLVTRYNSNYIKVAQVIAAILGENPETVRRTFSSLGHPDKADKNNPYKKKGVNSLLKSKLKYLNIDYPGLD